MRQVLGLAVKTKGRIPLFHIGMPDSSFLLMQIQEVTVLGRVQVTGLWPLLRETETEIPGPGSRLWSSPVPTKVAFLNLSPYLPPSFSLSHKEIKSIFKKVNTVKEPKVNVHCPVTFRNKGKSQIHNPLNALS